MKASGESSLMVRTANASPESLTATLIATLSAQYRFSPFSRWHRMATGRNNTSWLVVLEDHRAVVLRQYHTNSDEATIRYEHSILHHLKRQGFPVPHIIPSVNGQGCVVWNNRSYTLFEYCPGSNTISFLYRRLHPAIIPEAARTLAWYHRLMDGFVPEGRRQVREPRWFLEELSRHQAILRARHTLTPRDQSILRHLGPFIDRLAMACATIEAARARCPHTVIHGDFAPYNLLVYRGGITTVIDFADAHWDARVADVARALVTFPKWLGTQWDRVIAQRFLRAYEAKAPLSEPERAVLPAWMFFWQLSALCYHLRRYYDEGLLGYGPSAVRSVGLVRSMERHEARIQALVSKPR